MAAEDQFLDKPTSTQSQALKVKEGMIGFIPRIPMGTNGSNLVPKVSPLPFLGREEETPWERGWNGSSREEIRLENLKNVAIVFCHEIFTDIVAGDLKFYDGNAKENAT